jgi:sulfatase maturation enzyme AslB (radical SAM superfamily)
LCRAYRRFFSHIIPYAKAARKLINQSRPITELMSIAGTIH